MSDEPPTTRRASDPGGRNLANWALIIGLATLVMPLGIFGPIAVVLAVLAIRRGDRDRGKIALYIALGVIVIRVLLIVALRPGGPAV